MSVGLVQIGNSTWVNAETICKVERVSGVPVLYLLGGHQAKASWWPRDEATRLAEDAVEDLIMYIARTMAEMDALNYD
jgi:hypothetical protein